MSSKGTTQKAKKTENVLVEYITEDDLLQLEAQEANQDMVTTDWEQTMEYLAQPGTKVRVPRGHGFTRHQVVMAFQNAFELIGGTPRLAIWANTHTTDFYKLYAKLMPKQEQKEQTNEVLIRHVLPPSKLDE